MVCVLISSSRTEMLRLIDVVSLGDGCWRLGRLEWSGDLNPIENLRSSAEACSFAPQNTNVLRATLQEKWDALPQQTISQLVNSMRHRWRAVIDAPGHMTHY
uniref:Uncharacterized protein n=1 Tax=Poecilia latipinna TaxID=48699 RepID=A0A3B3VJM8_9TELE